MKTIVSMIMTKHVPKKSQKLDSLYAKLICHYNALCYQEKKPAAKSIKNTD